MPAPDRQRVVELVGLIALASVLLGAFAARGWWLAPPATLGLRAGAPLDRLAGAGSSNLPAPPGVDPDSSGQPLAVGPSSPPALCWRFRTGGLIAEAPVVADGAVYLGSWDGGVYALDAGTGAPRWRFPTGYRVDAAPAVVGGVVYVGSTGGFVAALEAATGRELWRVATAARPAATPTVAGGVLYVVGGVGGSRPAVSAGTVYAGGGDRSLQAIDAATGRERWRARLERNGVYALDAGAGQERWYLNTANPVRSGPVVDGDAVYAEDGLLYRIDAATGALRWQTRPSVPALSALVIAPPLLLVTGDDGPTIVDGMGRIGGWLIAVDAATGEERWRVPTGGPAWSAPAAAGGVAYVGGYDGSVYAVEATTGRERWRVPTGEKLLGTAVAGGMVYAAASDGSLFALGGGCGGLANDRHGALGRSAGTPES